MNDHECICGYMWQIMAIQPLQVGKSNLADADKMFQTHGLSLVARTTCSATACNQMTELLLRLALTLGADPTLDSSHRVLGQGSQRQTK